MNNYFRNRLWSIDDDDEMVKVEPSPPKVVVGGGWGARSEAQMLANVEADVHKLEQKILRIAQWYEWKGGGLDAE